MGMLLLLSLTLSLDSFRASLALGATKLPRARQNQTACAFGLCDGLAPLAGMLLGRHVVGYVGAWGEWLGPLMLGAYGVYVVWVARHFAASKSEEKDRWVVLGLPLSLSLDNLVAGASLGMINFPLLLSVIVIGATSGLMSLIGFRMAGMAITRLRINTELLGGVALVLIALTLALEN